MILRIGKDLPPAKLRVFTDRGAVSNETYSHVTFDVSPYRFAVGIISVAGWTGRVDMPLYVPLEYVNADMDSITVAAPFAHYMPPFQRNDSITDWVRVPLDDTRHGDPELFMIDVERQVAEHVMREREHAMMGKYDMALTRIVSVERNGFYCEVNGTYAQSFTFKFVTTIGGKQFSAMTRGDYGNPFDPRTWRNELTTVLPDHDTATLTGEEPSRDTALTLFTYESPDYANDSIVAYVRFDNDTIVPFQTLVSFDICNEGDTPEISAWFMAAPSDTAGWDAGSMWEATLQVGIFRPVSLEVFQSEGYGTSQESFDAALYRALTTATRAIYTDPTHCKILDGAAWKLRKDGAALTEEEYRAVKAMEPTDEEIAALFRKQAS